MREEETAAAVRFCGTLGEVISKAAVVVKDISFPLVVPALLTATTL